MESSRPPGHTAAIGSDGDGESASDPLKTGELKEGLSDAVGPHSLENAHPCSSTAYTMAGRKYV